MIYFIIQSLFWWGWIAIAARRAEGIASALVGGAIAFDFVRIFGSRTQP